MGYVDALRATPPGLALEISAAVHHAVQQATDYLAYRSTVRALSNLDKASLSDLGIARSEIRAKAREAVYGV